MFHYQFVTFSFIHNSDELLIILLVLKWGKLCNNEPETKGENTASLQSLKF